MGERAGQEDDKWRTRRPRARRAPTDCTRTHNAPIRVRRALAEVGAGRRAVVAPRVRKHGRVEQDQSEVSGSGAIFCKHAACRGRRRSENDARKGHLGGAWRLRRETRAASRVEASLLHKSFVQKFGRAGPTSPPAGARRRRRRPSSRRRRGCGEERRAAARAGPAARKALAARAGSSVASGSSRPAHRLATRSIASSSIPLATTPPPVAAEH